MVERAFDRLACGMRQELVRKDLIACSNCNRKTSTNSNNNKHGSANTVRKCSRLTICHYEPVSTPSKRAGFFYKCQWSAEEDEEEKKHLHCNGNLIQSEKEARRERDKQQQQQQVFVCSVRWPAREPIALAHLSLSLSLEIDWCLHYQVVVVLCPEAASLLGRFFVFCYLFLVLLLICLSRA